MVNSVIIRVWRKRRREKGKSRYGATPIGVRTLTAPTA